MKLAEVIHWKTNYAPGVRAFSDEKEARRLTTGAPGELHHVEGCWIFWPAAREPFPDAETLAQWESDYDWRPAGKTTEERLAALESKGV